MSDQRLDPDSDQYDPDGFHEGRGEWLADCERDEGNEEV